MFERVYKHQLDAKNRMRIPAKLREELGDNYTVTMGTGGCLYVFSEAEMTKVKEKLDKVSVFDAKAMKSVRKFLASVWDAEEDNQGRVLIPSNLREMAHIQKDVVILKNLRCLEIWAAEEWEKYLNDVDFDEAAEDLMRVTNDE